MYRVPAKLSGSGTLNTPPFLSGKLLTWSFFQMVPNPCTYPKASGYDFLTSSTTDILLQCIQHTVFFLFLQHFAAFPNSISKSSFLSTAFQRSHLWQRLNTSEPSQRRISLTRGSWHTPFFPTGTSFMQMSSPDVSGMIPNSFRVQSKQEQCPYSRTPHAGSPREPSASHPLYFFPPLPFCPKRPFPAIVLSILNETNYPVKKFPVNS